MLLAISGQFELTTISRTVVKMLSLDDFRPGIQSINHSFICSVNAVTIIIGNYYRVCEFFE